MLERLRERWRKVRSPVLALTDQAVFSLTNFALQIFLARSVTGSEFGAFTVGNTFFLLAAVLHQTFIVEPMFVMAPRRFENLKGAYLAALRRGWSVRFGFLIFAVGSGLALMARAFDLPLISDSVAAFAVSSPFVLYLWLLRRMAFLMNRMDISVLGGLVYAAVLGSALTVAISIGALTIVVAILISGLAALAGSAAVLYAVRWPSPELAGRPAALVHHLRYGHWAFESEIVNWMLANGPILVVPIWFGLQASGVLRVVSLSFMPLLQVTSAVTVLLLRDMSARRSDVTKPKAAPFWPLLGGAAAYASLVVVAGPFLLPAVFGPSYVTDRTLLAVAGTATSLFVASQAFFVVLRSDERPRDVLLVHLLVLAITVALAPLAFIFGPLGVFMAQVPAWVAGLLWAARKVAHVGPPRPSVSRAPSP